VNYRNIQSVYFGRQRTREVHVSDTLIYQPKYDLTPEENAEYPVSKSIKPDFVLQDLQGVQLALIA